MARLLFCCSIQDTLIEVNGLLCARVNGAKLVNASTSTFFNLSMQGSYADDILIFAFQSILQKKCSLVQWIYLKA